MKTQLTEEQVQQLFAFTEKKYVKWYDLQCELVDHLAEMIESEMSTNNTLTFKSALDKVYSSFGIFGFSQIVREKEEQLRRQTKKLYRSEVLKMFKWPNIIKSATIFMALYFLSIITNAIYLYAAFSILLITGFIIFIVKTKTGKKSKQLLMTQYFPTAGFGGFIYFQFWANMWRFDLHEIQPVNNLLFITVIFFGIISYFASYTVMKNVTGRARQLYPEVYTTA